MVFFNFIKLMKILFLLVDLKLKSWLVLCDLDVSMKIDFDPNLYKCTGQQVIKLKKLSSYIDQLACSYH